MDIDRGRLIPRVDLQWSVMVDSGMEASCVFTVDPHAWPHLSDMSHSFKYEPYHPDRTPENIHSLVEFWQCQPVHLWPPWLMSIAFGKGRMVFTSASPALQYPGALDPNQFLHIYDENYWLQK